MTNPQQDVPPQAKYIEILEKFWLARAVSAAARLGVADALADGPQTVGELARATKTHEPSLARLVRALVSFGFIRQAGDGAGDRPPGLGRLELTELGRLLVSDEPGSMRHLLMSLIGGEHYTAWGELEHAVRTGEIAFNHHYGVDVWTFFRENPDRGEEFNRTMVAATASANAAIVEAWDFRPYRHIVDVGGGHGSLLRVALEQNTTARGTLFDLPHVIDAAEHAMAEAGLADRVKLERGSFFETVPAGGDAYMLKYILHDWDDATCLKILRNVRKAIAEGGTLLVFDTVIAPPGNPDFSTLMDLNMLTMTGGRERTEAELAELFAESGFRLKRLLPTQSHISITEAAPV